MSQPSENSFGSTVITPEEDLSKKNLPFAQSEVMKLAGHCSVL
jgi:hypothetical protein